jgi:hypothetical protein
MQNKVDRERPDPAGRKGWKRAKMVGLVGCSLGAAHNGQDFLQTGSVVSGLATAITAGLTIFVVFQLAKGKTHTDGHTGGDDDKGTR